MSRFWYDSAAYELVAKKEARYDRVRSIQVPSYLLKIPHAIQKDTIDVSTDRGMLRSPYRTVSPVKFFPSATFLGHRSRTPLFEGDRRFRVFVLGLLRTQAQNDAPWRFVGESLAGMSLGSDFEKLDATTFVHRNGAGRPSEAIRRLWSQQLVLECVVAMSILLYTAILARIGDDRFDERARTRPLVFRMGGVADSGPAEWLRASKTYVPSFHTPRQIERPPTHDGMRPVQQHLAPGDFCYMRSIYAWFALPAVSSRPRTTSLQGENCMYFGPDERTREPLFLAFVRHEVHVPMDLVGREDPADRASRASFQLITGNRLLRAMATRSIEEWREYFDDHNCPPVELEQIRHSELPITRVTSKLQIGRGTTATEGFYSYRPVRWDDEVGVVSAHSMCIPPPEDDDIKKLEDEGARMRLKIESHLRDRIAVCVNKDMNDISQAEGFMNNLARA